MIYKSTPRATGRYWEPCSCHPLGFDSLAPTAGCCRCCRHPSRPFGSATGHDEDDLGTSGTRCSASGKQGAYPGANGWKLSGSLGGTITVAFLWAIWGTSKVTAIGCWRAWSMSKIRSICGSCCFGPRITSQLLYLVSTVISYTMNLILMHPAVPMVSLFMESMAPL